MSTDENAKTKHEIIQGLPANEFHSFMESFRFFDRDGKGFITPDDFRNALTQIQSGRPAEEKDVEALMKEYDKEGEGKVTFDDLVTVTARRRFGYELGKEKTYNFKYISYLDKKEEKPQEQSEHTDELSIENCQKDIEQHSGEDVVS